MMIYDVVEIENEGPGQGQKWIYPKLVSNFFNRIAKKKPR